MCVYLYVCLANSIAGHSTDTSYMHTYINMLLACRRCSHCVHALLYVHTATQTLLRKHFWQCSRPPGALPTYIHTYIHTHMYVHTGTQTLRLRKHFRWCSGASSALMPRNATILSPFMLLSLRPWHSRFRQMLAEHYASGCITHTWNHRWWLYTFLCIHTYIYTCMYACIRIYVSNIGEILYFWTSHSYLKHRRNDRWWDPVYIRIVTRTYTHKYSHK